MAKSKGKAAVQDDVRLYTLRVSLLYGRSLSEKFVRENPVVSRTIQIRGDQTLEDLHHAIHDAFDRKEDQKYEFQFGEGPMDPDNLRYVLPAVFESRKMRANPPAGRVDWTSIGSLYLEVDRSFGYRFDLDANWWHAINVEAVEDEIPRGKFPKMTKRVGKSPPQYAEEDE